MRFPEPDRHGFTLLETAIALVLLNLMVVGIVKLVMGNERQIEALSSWSAKDPSFYLVPETESLGRALGLPAQLSEKPHPVGPGIPPGGNFELTVLSRDRSLDPPSQSALIRMKERVPNSESGVGHGEKGKKEKGHEEGRKKKGGKRE